MSVTFHEKNERRVKKKRQNWILKFSPKSLKFTKSCCTKFSGIVILFGWSNLKKVSKLLHLTRGGISGESNEELIKLMASGIQKAAVFPVPVCAEPRISFPFNAGGIAFAWIGVGSVMPLSANADTTGLAKPKCSKLFKKFSFWLLSDDQNSLDYKI